QIAFGHSDEVDGLLRGNRYHQRLWIGESDVFGGENHHSSYDEKWILSGLEHACHPVHRGIRVRASKRLDERGDDVVMLVTGSIVKQGASLHRVFDGGKRDESS